MWHQTDPKLFLRFGKIGLADADADADADAESRETPGKILQLHFIIFYRNSELVFGSSRSE